MPKKTKPSVKPANKRHSVSLSNNAYSALRTFRDQVPQRSFSAAVETAVAPSRAGFDLAHPSLTQEREWFTTEQTASASLAKLRGFKATGADLITEAAKLAGMTVDDFTRASALEAAKRRFLDHYRLSAGATNVKGASDGKIAEAAAALVKAGIQPTLYQLRQRTGCNRTAVVRWMEAHPDELIVAPTTPAA